MDQDLAEAIGRDFDGGTRVEIAAEPRGIRQDLRD
jgi:hypothetical protein